jgi:hypothetical protein
VRSLVASYGDALLQNVGGMPKQAAFGCLAVHSSR